MLFALTFSRAETVLGLLRDGAVHHETLAAAAVHSSSSTGDHGHEDDDPHGPEHQHGTPSDHCTHQHGTVIPSPQDDLIAYVDDLPELVLSPSSWTDFISDPFAPPPQA